MFQASARSTIALHTPPFVLALLTLVLPACGGSTASSNANSPKSGETGTEKNAPSATSSSDPAASPAPEKVTLEFPTACAKEGKSGDVCVPPEAFAKHLCSAPNASTIALAMFAKGTPWLRLYLARNTEAWDMAGGAAAGAERTKLAFDEEVLVLAFHPPANTGGMQVSGANGTYDVLRWDGVCATLNADELRKWYPPEPGYASIPWKRLDDEMQQKLLADGRISMKEGEMKKACKGLSRSQSTPACDRAQKSLSKAVVGYVRATGDLPVPKLQ